MNRNPFLTSGTSSNPFHSNLYPNNSPNFNNNSNSSKQTAGFNINPFKVSNNTTSNNNISTSSFNNSDIFSKLKTNITDNSTNNIFNNNNNNYNNFSSNPFLANNTTNKNNIFNNNNGFSSNNNINNNLNYSFGNQNNQNYKLYNFNNGISVRLPVCQTFGKTPITTFNNKINYQKDYIEKNKIGQGEYNNTRLEYVCNDENLKHFSIQEIRMNDYINAKIPYFDKWSKANFVPTNEKINSFCVNTNNNTTNNYSNNNNNFNNGNNGNTFSIFNQNNKSSFLNNGISNGNTNPFLNNNNTNNNPFSNNLNNNTNNNNPFNNNGNNNTINFLGNNNNNIFNNPNNPFNTNSNKNIFNNNNNNNIFNNNNNGNNISFGNNLGNNNIFNNSSNNIFLKNSNNTNNNPLFNQNNNNIFNNNTNNIFNNNNNNNNNIFNNPNPFKSILDNNNNNSSINNSTNYFGNNSINNNYFANNIFNNNTNNLWEKPFEEMIKDPTWVKRNVRLIEEKDLDNWIFEPLEEITKINLKIKEMEYYDLDEGRNRFDENENGEKSEPLNLVFNKIVLASDEEISNYYKNLKEQNEKNKEEKIIEKNNYEKKRRWEPIHIQNNDDNNLQNNSTMGKRYENKYETEKPKISGFAEASKILSNLDYNFVDFNYNGNNREQKEYILPTERPGFFKFNNMINNKQTYISSSLNNNNEIEYNNLDLDNNINNNIIQEIDEYNNQNIDADINYNNKELIQKDNIDKNNLFNKPNSEKTTKINTDEVARNLIINENINNDDKNLETDNLENECKLIFSGESKNIPELQIPIIIRFSTIIDNNSHLLNFDLITDIITKNISSIENIENKIVIPKKEDIFLKINGKIYSQLTNIEININEVEKFYENKNFYYYMYYGFKLKQYPLIENDLTDLDNNYMTKPTIEELLNPDNNYDLKKVENFEIWNKYGKVVFLEPINLSGKIIINDIIKINYGEIDLNHERVDKLKAKAFLHYNFGYKLEGTYLENLIHMLNSLNGTFVKYENEILEYNINC